MLFFIMKITSFLFFIFAFLLSVSFVSAQYYGGYGPSYGGGFFGGTEQVIDSIVRNIEPFLRALLGGNDWTGYLLFEKTLLFILISIIVGLVLGNLPVFSGLKNKKVLRLVAVIIGLLGVRNLNYIWVGTILVQYQVLFIAVTGILPFIIYWYFLKSFDSPIKKTAWIFYAVIYFGLWATTDLEAYNEVYFWSAIVALIYAFFVDSWFMKWLAIRAAKLGDSQRRDAMIAVLKRDIDEYKAQQAAGYLSAQSAKGLIDRKNDVIRAMMKE